MGWFPAHVKRLDFIYFDAGGGHRSAALALKAVAEQQQRPWQVRLVNLQEVLDPLDVFRKVTGVRLQDLYNQLLKKGFTIGTGPLLRVMQLIVKVYHGSQVKLLSEFWRDSRPDILVSLVPNFNRALFEGLRSADRAARAPDTPMVTILTDMADYPPHFWIEKQPQFLICGTSHAAEQAKGFGHSNGNVFQTTGMILRPKFYEQITADRRTERLRLRLHADLPTGLVLFGGEGSQWMKGIAKRVSDSNLQTQLIFICGRNRALAEELQRLPLRFPVVVEGFTSEIPYYMHVSDYLIGKPGPGSISEALAMKLPVVVEKNIWTMVQERFNADWVREKQVGIVLDSFRNIVPALRELLDPERLQQFRDNAAAIQNRAVFEIPEILDALLQSAEAPSMQHRE